MADEGRNIIVTNSRIIVYALLFILVFGIAFLSAGSRILPVPELSIVWHIERHDPSEVERYVPSYSFASGSELIFVYIGSGACGPSNDEDLPDLIERLKLILQLKAAENNAGFAAIGLALDWEVRSGLEHLAKFGRFDEIATGRSWLNIGAVEYIWHSVPGFAATPQIVVVERVIDGGATSSNQRSRLVIAEKKLLARKIGTDEMREWVEQNAPLPGPYSAAASAR